MKWLAGMGAIGIALAAVLTAFTRSAAAAELGLANDPQNPLDLARILWTAAHAPTVLAVVRSHYPDAHLTSGYRNDAVNAAVKGSPSSFHRYGLAFDVGGLATFADVVAAARVLRASVGQLGDVRTILAEQTRGLHVHLDFFDPFNSVTRDRNGPAFYQENPDASWSPL